MYLQLAESGHSTPKTPYVFLPNFNSAIPKKGTFVREDFFDSLTDSEFNDLMNYLQPFQPNQGMSSKAERAARRASRQQRKDDRNTRRNSRNDAKNVLINARADAKKNGKGIDWGGVIGQVTNTAAGIFGGAAGGANAPGGPLSPDQQGATPEGSWFDRTNFLGLTNKQTVIGGAVLGVATFAGVKIFRKRKRK